VIIIDGATDSVITTVSVGHLPEALIWNSTSNKVYCANRGGLFDLDSTITIIDGSADSVITTVRVGINPHALVWNSTNNKVYCANNNSNSNSVTIIDGLTDSVITTITVGNNPNSLVYNPINNKVFCTNELSDNVSVIDGSTDTVITTISTGYGPWVSAWNSIQNRIYVGNYWGSSISVIRDEIPGIEESSTFDAERLMPEIYPNPVKGVLRVHGPLTVKEVGEIKIFDVSEKLIKEIEILRFAQNDKEGEVKISLKGINPGIYFVQFGKESITKKLVITK
jgi:YVTN family beta-propeller protein